MDKNLIISAFSKFFLGLVLVMLLIFLPAGSLQYTGGWLLIALLFIPMFIAGLLMMKKNPDLLRRRLQAKENRSDQSLVIKLSGLMFILGFVIAGLDYRFGWFILPGWLSILASVLFLAAYLLYGEVLRENAYLSRTIRVEDCQPLIDTGLYGIVRHPMYTATIFLFTAMPLVLGSLIALPVFLCYPILMIIRIKDEEKLLEKELSGYSDYQKRVPWRILPYIW